jgi:hypothetical protein
MSLRIVIATWKAEYVELAALHLSNPLTTVQTLYGHLGPVLTWEADSNKKFGSETVHGEGPLARWARPIVKRRQPRFSFYGHERLSNARGHWKSFFVLVWYLCT